MHVVTRKSKKSIFNPFGLALAISLTFCLSGQAQNIGNEENMTTPSILEAIHNRRSVRSFIDREVTKDQIITLIKAAMAAPSGRDMRPWQFIVVNDRAVLDELASSLPTAKGPLSQAPVAIVICGDMAKNAVKGTDYWVADCSLAAQNLLLAVETLQLGAVYTGTWPYPDREAHVKNVLNLPQSIRPLCVIPIGYPAKETRPKDKWNPDLIHWNSWPATK